MAAGELGAAFPRVDVFLGVGAATALAAALRRPAKTTSVGPPRPPLAGIGARPRLTARHVAYVKIAEGCDHPCSFCVIPRLRGRYRSRAADDVVREVEGAAAAGAREVVLLAQDTSRWGEDLGNGSTLASLLTRLASCGVPWIRVLYLHPGRVTDELVATFGALEPVLNYFDLPLQHVSPSVLAAMGRPAWTPEETLGRLQRWRELAPGAVFRTTLIAGFPGEREEDFRALASFVAVAALDHVGVFAFSAEQGTAAAGLGGAVPAVVAQARREELMFRQQDVLASKYAALKGRTWPLLLDAVRGDEGVGRFWFQAPEADPVTRLKGGRGFCPGDFVRARVAGNDGYELVAARATAEGNRA
jgi:ribosomal protein S12 methylthiotransferase